jgi:virulence factor Mce-like protein
MGLAVITVFVLTCFGAGLYLWLAFGGAVPLKPEGYRFTADFPQAVQLAQQSDVRIAGVSVGKVVSVAAGKGDRAVATIELDSQYAPIPRDAHAVLRLKSLLGETYIELAPGSASSGLLPDGGHLPNSAISNTVQLDQLLKIFDPATRRAFQEWQQYQAGAVGGRGAAINEAFGNLPVFVDSTDGLLASLQSQSAGVRELISGTGDFFSAISARQGELQGLIAASNRLWQTTAARNQDFADIFRALPRFELESRLTLPRLTELARVGDPIVRELEPVASAFQPNFAALNQLAPQFKGFFARLGPVITASERGFPAFQQILAKLPPLLGKFEPFLRNANPIVAYLASYEHEITGFFANVTAASLGRDFQLPLTTNQVHYVRTAQTLNPEALAFYPRTLGASRNNAYLPPTALNQLTSLPVLNPANCQNGDPAQPTDAIPSTLTPLIQKYVFRTTAPHVATPACRGQGTFPGFSTVFPQLRAEP